MGTLGSASIELTLERSQFDSDIKSLSSEKLDPIGVKLEIDTKDFNKQIKGLAGFIEPLLIPVELDTRGIAKQLKELKLDCIPVNICPDLEGLDRKLKDFDGEIYVKVKFDEGQVQSAIAQINTQIQANIQATVKVEQSGASSSTSSAAVGDAISRSMADAFDRQMAGKRQDTASQNFVDFTLSPIKAFTSSLNSIATGALENIGKGLTESLSKSLAGSLNKEIGSALSEAGSKTGGLLGQIGKKIGINSSSKEDQKKANSESSKTSFTQIEAGLKPLAKEVSAIAQVLQKTGLDVGGFAGQINKATGAATSLVSAFAKLESVFDSSKTSHHPTKGFLNGDARNVSTIQAKGQVDASVKQLEAKFAEIKQMPVSPVSQSKAAQLAQEITAIKKQIDADINNQDIPESVRRSLGQLKGRKSRLSRLETEANRLSLSADNLTGDAYGGTRSRERRQSMSMDIPLSQFRSGGEGDSKKDKSKPRWESFTPVPPKQERASEPRNDNELEAATANFRKVFIATVKASGIDPNHPSLKIPSLSFSLNNPGAAGQYSGQRNEILLPPVARKKLASGDVSLSDVDTLVHEIRHAFQSNFGRNPGVLINPKFSSVPLIRGNEEDRHSAEKSTQLFVEGYQKKTGNRVDPMTENAVRAIEEDAYAFAKQKREQIYKDVFGIKNQTIDQALTGKPRDLPKPKRESFTPIPPKQEQKEETFVLDENAIRGWGKFTPIPPKQEQKAATASKAPARTLPALPPAKTLLALPAARTLPALPPAKTLLALPAARTLPALPPAKTLLALPAARTLPALPPAKTLLALPAARTLPALPAPPPPPPPARKADLRSAQELMQILKDAKAKQDKIVKRIQQEQIAETGQSYRPSTIKKLLKSGQIVDAEFRAFQRDRASAASSLKERILEGYVPPQSSRRSVATMGADGKYRAVPVPGAGTATPIPSAPPETKVVEAAANLNLENWLKSRKKALSNLVSDKRRSVAEIQLGNIKSEVQKNLDEIQKIIAEIQAKEIEKGIYRTRQEIANSLRRGQYKDSRYDAAITRTKQLQQMRADIGQGKNVASIVDPLTAQRRLVAQNDPALARVRDAQKKLDEIARLAQKEIEETTGQRRRLSTVKKLLASGEGKDLGVYGNYESAAQEKAAATSALNRRRREVMRAKSLPKEEDGTQDYWEQQFRRLEARFYRSGMMKNVAPKDRRSMTSEATGFLFSGAALVSPGATFAALLAPLAPAIAPLAITFGLLNNALQPLIATIVATLKRLEPAQKRLEYVGGGKEGGVRETDFALGLSDELKTPALASLEGYSKLAAASKGTSLEGNKTKDLFIGISTAAKAMQLSQEDLNLVMLGFTQIISKGKLSAEEVRQQISERLPGAFNIFAKSLGLSVAEFNQLLESGSLLSEDVIPKLAKGLQQEFGQAAKESSGSFLSSLTRVENAFFAIQKGLADVFGPVFATFTNGFAQLVELVAKNIKPLIQIFNVAMIGIAAQFFVGLTTIMNGSGITAKLTAFLIPAFARVFTTLTPFAVGIVADFLDDVFGAKSSVMDNMMKGCYNMVVSVILVVDGAIKKFKELLNISDSINLKDPNQKAGASASGNKIVDTIAPAAVGALAGATIGIKGGVIGAAAGGIFGLVGGMDLLRKVIPSTVIEFASLTLMLIQTATLAKMALGPVLANLAGGFKALSLAFLENVKSGSVFKSSLNTLTAGLASSQLVMAGATAAVLLFFAKADFSDELGSKFDKLGDRMSEALYKIRDAAYDARKSLEKLPSQTPDFKSKGFDLTLGFGGENGFRTDDVIKANRGEQSNPLIRALTFSPILSAANALGFKPSTLGEKQFDDTLLKIYGQSEATGKSIDESGLLNGTFSQTKAGQSFENIKSVDSQVKTLQQQRLGVVSQVGATKDPNSIAYVQGIDKQIKDLLQQREELVKPVEQLRNGILEASNTVEDALTAIAESDLPAPAKEEAKNRITVTLNQIGLAKKKLEEFKAIDLSPLGNSFTDVQRQIEKSTIEFEKATELDNVAKSKSLSGTYGDFTAGKITKKQLDKNVFNLEESDLELTESRLSDILGKRGGQLDDLQSIPNPNKDQKEIIEKTQKEIRDKELRLAQTRIQIAQKTAEGKRLTEEQILKDFQDANAKAAAIIQRQETQDIATIKGKQFKGVITKERADFDIAKVQESSSNKDLLEAKRQIAEFQKTRNQLTPETAQKQEIELNKQMAAANLKAIEARLNTKEIKRQTVLSGLEFSNKQAEGAIAFNQSDSTRIAKEKLLGLGLTSEANDQFAVTQNQIDQKAAVDKIALIKKRIAENRRLLVDGTNDAKAAAEAELALKQELAQANTQLIDLKIAAEEKYRETVERGIQRIMQAEENRFKSLTSQLDFQKAGLDLYNQSLERTGKLEESRYNLRLALTDAGVAPLENKRDNANKALELSRRLKDDNLDPGVRNAVTSQLSEMGFGTNELQILAQRSQIEDEIAAKKLESLKLEQEYQRKSLQLDLQKQKIAAETAIYDAESAKLAAAKSKLEAEGALRIAQIKKDPQAIESAKVGLEIAGREIDLSDKRLDNALANLGIQDELTKNAIMAQEITQRTTIDQLLAADKTRKQGEGVEKAEAMVQPKPTEASSSDSATEGKGKRRGRRPGRIGETFVENGRTIKDGVDITNYQYDETLNIGQGNPRAPGTDPVEALGMMKPGSAPVTSNPDLQLPKHIDINQMPSLSRKPGEDIFQSYQRNWENQSREMEATKKVSANSSDRSTQFSEALKIANQEVVQRLDRLIGATEVGNSKPRNLTVSTPNPVDDAAKILNDYSRGQLTSQGM